jgi:hypothetical protein
LIPRLIGANGPDRRACADEQLFCTETQKCSECCDSSFIMKRKAVRFALVGQRSDDATNNSLNGQKRPVARTFSAHIEVANTTSQPIASYRYIALAQVARTQIGIRVQLTRVP